MKNALKMEIATSNITKLKHDSEKVIIFFEHRWIVIFSLEIFRILALIASLVNIKVLAAIKSSVSIYKLLVVMAFVDFLYTVTLFGFRMTELACNKNPAVDCPNIQYLFFAGYILVSDYLTSCLAFFNILLEIFITLQRLFMISNKLPHMKNSSKMKIVSLVICVISFSIYIPVLFMKRVELKPNQNEDLKVREYQLVKTEFGQSKAATVIMNCQILTRIFLLLVVLLVLNTVTVFKFRRFLKRRKLHLEKITCKYFSLSF